MDQSEGLLMKTSILEKIKNKIIENKNYFIVALVIMIIAAIIIKL